MSYPIHAGARVTDGSKVGTVSIVSDRAGQASATALGRWDDGEVFAIYVSQLRLA